MSTTRRGFGLFAGISPEVIRAAAASVESAGYNSFWVNYPGQVDGLAVLAQAAAVTNRVDLGVGVIPLTTRAPASIADGVHQNRLPLNRLLLGVGSPNPGALQRVREGVAELRAGVASRVVVAALGPRMCRLAGEVADGVLLNWLAPDHARTSAAWVREGAAAAGRPAPTLITYVRVALGNPARARLAREAATYEGIGAYADHFKRMGVRAIDTAVAGDTPEEIQAGLAQWDGVLDEVVVRGITANDTEPQVLELIRAAAPSSASGPS
jgi:alkanesulfonate monooxygenase SsuD/methylene tetrahydromethanopterin reductase-like flavin-dependent oxidoreductase (luciferase family)